MKNFDRRTLCFSVAVAIVSVILIGGIFRQQNKQHESQIAALEAKLREGGVLLANQQVIEKNYEELAGKGGGASMSDWIARLSEDARLCGFTIDALVPRDSKTISVRFRSDLESLAEFFSSIVRKDSLSRIEEIRLLKTQKGALDCEISLLRVAP